MRTPLLISILALTLAACNGQNPEAPASGNEAALTAKANADVAAATADADQ